MASTYPYPTEGKLYYYLEIPHFTRVYGGTRDVYKSQGHGAEDAEHRAFYEPHFAAKGSKLLIRPFIADRIEKVNGEWVKFTG